MIGQGRISGNRFLVGREQGVGWFFLIAQISGEIFIGTVVKPVGEINAEIIILFRSGGQNDMRCRFGLELKEDSKDKEHDNDKNGKIFYFLKAGKHKNIISNKIVWG